MSVIEGGVPIEKVVSLRELADKAQAFESYGRYPRTPFIFEILDHKAWSESLIEVVDLWVEDASNIQRATDHVHRRPVLKGSKLVLEFCVFRLKSPNSPNWQRPESLRTDERQQQTIVFIALDDLSITNGFFTSLKQGQAICVGDKEDILFPPTGGGLGIFVALDI